MSTQTVSRSHRGMAPWDGSFLKWIALLRRMYPVLVWQDGGLSWDAADRQKRRLNFR